MMLRELYLGRLDGFVSLADLDLTESNALNEAKKAAPLGSYSVQSYKAGEYALYVRVPVEIDKKGWKYDSKIDSDKGRAALAKMLALQPDFLDTLNDKAKTWFQSKIPAYDAWVASLKAAAQELKDKGYSETDLANDSPYAEKPAATVAPAIPAEVTPVVSYSPAPTEPVASISTPAVVVSLAPEPSPETPPSAAVVAAEVPQVPETSTGSTPEFTSVVSGDSDVAAGASVASWVDSQIPASKLSSPESYSASAYEAGIDGLVAFYPAVAAEAEKQFGPTWKDTLLAYHKSKKGSPGATLVVAAAGVPLPAPEAPEPEPAVVVPNAQVTPDSAPPMDMATFLDQPEMASIVKSGLASVQGANSIMPALAAQLMMSLADANPALKAQAQTAFGSDWDAKLKIAFMAKLAEVPPEAPPAAPEPPEPSFQTKLDAVVTTPSFAGVLFRAQNISQYSSPEELLKHWLQNPDTSLPPAFAAAVSAFKTDAEIDELLAALEPMLQATPKSADAFLTSMLDGHPVTADVLSASKALQLAPLGAAQRFIGEQEATNPPGQFSAALQAAFGSMWRDPIRTYFKTHHAADLPGMAAADVVSAPELQAVHQKLKDELAAAGSFDFDYAYKIAMSHPSVAAKNFFLTHVAYKDVDDLREKLKPAFAAMYPEPAPVVAPPPPSVPASVSPGWDKDLEAGKALMQKLPRLDTFIQSKLNDPALSGDADVLAANVLDLLGIEKPELKAAAQQIAGADWDTAIHALVLDKHKNKLDMSSSAGGDSLVATVPGLADFVNAKMSDPDLAGLSPYDFGVAVFHALKKTPALYAAANAAGGGNGSSWAVGLSAAVAAKKTQQDASVSAAPTGPVLGGPPVSAADAPQAMAALLDTDPQILSVFNGKMNNPDLAIVSDNLFGLEVVYGLDDIDSTIAAKLEGQFGPAWKKHLRDAAVVKRKKQQAGGAVTPVSTASVVISPSIAGPNEWLNAHEKKGAEILTLLPNFAAFVQAKLDDPANTTPEDVANAVTVGVGASHPELVSALKAHAPWGAAVAGITKYLYKKKKGTISTPAVVMTPVAVAPVAVAPPTPVEPMGSALASYVSPLPMSDMAKAGQALLVTVPALAGYAQKVLDAPELASLTPGGFSSVVQANLPTSLMWGMTPKQKDQFLAFVLHVKANPVSLTAPTTPTAATPPLQPAAAQGLEFLAKNASIAAVVQAQFDDPANANKDPGEFATAVLALVPAGAMTAEEELGVYSFIKHKKKHPSVSIPMGGAPAAVEPLSPKAAQGLAILAADPALAALVQAEVDNPENAYDSPAEFAQAVMDALPPGAVTNATNIPLYNFIKHKKKNPSVSIPLGGASAPVAPVTAGLSGAAGDFGNYGPPAPTVFPSNTTETWKSFESLDPTGMVVDPNAPNLGGQYPKTVLKKPNLPGQYLFKPSVTGPAPAGAAVSSARLASALLPGTVVPIIRTQVNGEEGSFQPMLPNMGTLDNKSVTSMSPETIKSLQHNRVFDWLVGDHDGKGGNFLQLADGSITRIDRDRSFKPFVKGGSDKLDTSYNPTGETPIYNELYKAYAEKKLDLNPMDTLPMIRQIESMPDELYKQAMLPYVAALSTQEGLTADESEAVFAKALKRKKNIRKDFEGFFTTLRTARGEPGVFQYPADNATTAPVQGAAAPVVAPVSAPTPTVVATVATVSTTAVPAIAGYVSPVPMSASALQGKATLAKFPKLAAYVQTLLDDPASASLTPYAFSWAVSTGAPIEATAGMPSGSWGPLRAFLKHVKSHPSASPLPAPYVSPVPMSVLATKGAAILADPANAALAAYVQSKFDDPNLSQQASMDFTDAVIDNIPPAMQASLPQFGLSHLATFVLHKKSYPAAAVATPVAAVAPSAPAVAPTPVPTPVAGLSSKSDTGPIPAGKIAKTFDAKEYASEKGVSVKAHATDSNQVVLKVSKQNPEKSLQDFADELDLKQIAPPVTGSQQHMIFVAKPDFDAAKILKHIKAPPPPPPPPPGVNPQPAFPTVWAKAEPMKPLAPNPNEVATLASKTLGFHGTPIYTDGGMLEGQVLRFRKVLDQQGKLYYACNFKLTEADWKSLKAGTKGNIAGVSKDVAPPRLKYDAALQVFKEVGGKTGYTATTELPMSGIGWEVEGSSVGLATNTSSQAAMAGSLYCQIHPKPGEDPKAAFERVMSTLNPTLGAKLMKPPTKAEIEEMKMNRTLWAVMPQTHDAFKALPKGKQTAAAARALLLGDDATFQALFPSPSSRVKLERSLQVKADELDAVEPVEAYPGYMTHRIKDRWKKLGGGKLRYLTHGTPSMEAALDIMGLGGKGEGNLMGSHEKLVQSQFGSAHSAGADIASGSGDGVLLQAMTQGAIDANQSLSSAAQWTRAYNFLIPPDEADRLDAYMHCADTYGITAGGTGQNAAWDTRVSVDQAMSIVHADAAGTSYTGPKPNYVNAHANEISFRKGIAAKRILRVVCSTGGTLTAEQNRAAIIQAAKAKGVTEVNGIPVDDFFVCESKVKDVYEKYVKPAGYEVGP